MATATSQLSVQDYLKMTCEPDCEFVDGVVEGKLIPADVFELPGGKFVVPMSEIEKLID